MLRPLLLFRLCCLRSSDFLKIHNLDFFFFIVCMVGQSIKIGFLKLVRVGVLVYQMSFGIYILYFLCVNFWLLILCWFGFLSCSRFCKTF